MLSNDSMSDSILEIGMPMQTSRRWKHQALIDAGLEQIKSLEKELQLVKDTSEICDSLVVGPKDDRHSR